MSSQIKELADLVMLKPSGVSKEKLALGKSLLERLVIVDVHGRQVLKDLIAPELFNEFEFRVVEETL